MTHKEFRTLLKGSIEHDFVQFKDPKEKEFCLKMLKDKEYYTLDDIMSHLEHNNELLQDHSMGSFKKLLGTYRDDLDWEDEGL